ncbi:SCAN domain-containing protein 3 [Trichonephila clavipes]|nr:SCAN domain-containing protein 3 [Trichonephila clavipes]
MKNITSCAADGAPNIIGKKNGCLKWMKDVNPEIILVHCVIHRQNLVAKNISPVLNEVLHTVIKCVVIKTSAKCERLFKLFCEEQNEDHGRSSHRINDMGPPTCVTTVPRPLGANYGSAAFMDVEGCLFQFLSSTQSAFFH